MRVWLAVATLALLPTVSNAKQPQASEDPAFATLAGRELRLFAEKVDQRTGIPQLLGFTRNAEGRVAGEGALMFWGPNPNGGATFVLMHATPVEQSKWEGYQRTYRITRALGIRIPKGQYVPEGGCQFRGKDDDALVVVARQKDSDREVIPAVAAWRFDRQAKAFRKISTSGVTCLHFGP